MHDSSPFEKIAYKTKHDGGNYFLYGKTQKSPPFLYNKAVYILFILLIVNTSVVYMCLYACAYQNNKTPLTKTDKWIVIAFLNVKWILIALTVQWLRDEKLNI